MEWITKRVAGVIEATIPPAFRLPGIECIRCWQATFGNISVAELHMIYRRPGVLRSLAMHDFAASGLAAAAAAAAPAVSC